MCSFVSFIVANVNIMNKRLFIICLIFTLKVNAQNYINETARWKQYQSWYGFGQSSLNNTEYYFNGDTTINGIYYYKMWSDLESNFTTYTYDSLGNPVTNTVTNSSTGLAGYFREQNKKFYLIAYANPEVMLYDFDVAIGDYLDSIATNSYCGLSHPVLMNLDTVCIGEIGRKRWGISFSTYPSATFYIEGVGPNSGFRASICRNGCPECGYGLNLFTMNGDTLYNGTCSIFPNDIDEIGRKTKLQIIAFEEELQIEGKDINEIYLFSSVGQIVSVFTNLNSNRLSINTNNLQTGIYFIRAKLKNGIVTKPIYIK